MPKIAAALLVVFALSTCARAETSDLGAVSFENSGAPEAQEAFTRGLAALHSFWYGEAADAFREAQAADPGFALAYWGEALTYDHPLWEQQDLASAHGALERLAADAAGRRERAGSERERAYLDTLETLFYGEGSREERHRAYSEALDELRRRYPEDEDAAALYALSLQTFDRKGASGERLRVRSAAVLEELLDAHPEHPGVLHYLIHAYDDPTHAPLGLRPALVYARVAPAAPHALHMPSHIFLQLGMWERVVSSNIDAYAASVAWVERKELDRAQEDFHSLAWLHYAYLQLGKIEDAERELELALAAAAETGNPRVVRYSESMRGRQMIETGKWKVTEIDLAGAPPAQVLAEGLAAAATGEYERAEAAITALRGTRPVARIRVKEVEGAVAIARGKTEKGMALLAEAAELERALDPPSGPVSPAKPALELYGEHLVEQGRFDEAIEVLRESLVRTPNRTLSVRALAAARAGAAASAAESTAGH